MKTVTHLSTLLWYNGPQVFEARDPIGGHYVAASVNDTQHLLSGVEPSALRSFRIGAVDLRTLITAHGSDQYLVTADPITKPIELAHPVSADRSHEFLPKPGLYLDLADTSSVVLKESRGRDNLVLEISAESRTGDNKMLLNTYVTLLGEVQTLVNHAYSRANKTLPKKVKRTKTRMGPLLDVVVPASPGSLKVLLEAVEPPDLFGQSEVARAMAYVDRLFDTVAEPEVAIKVAASYRGHLAGAYVRLLRVLSEHGTRLAYSWADPASDHETMRSISPDQANALVSLAHQMGDELVTESVEVVGEFERMNLGQGRWSLKTDDGTIVSGHTRDDEAKLDGLVAGLRYRFSCIEELHVDSIGRETRDLYCVHHEPARDDGAP